MDTDYLQLEANLIKAERDAYIQQANIQVAAFNGALQWIEQQIKKVAQAATKEEENHEPD